MEISISFLCLWSIKLDTNILCFTADINELIYYTVARCDSNLPNKLGVLLFTCSVSNLLVQNISTFEIEYTSAEYYNLKVKKTKKNTNI